MKKTLLILCALLLTAIGASAQITDVTATYIKNASFEEDDVSNMEVDGDRSSEVEGVQTGAWKVTSPTDWTLTGSPSVSDIMTKDASATDNNFGAPGAPSDGDQMLYLRDSWTVKTASITQEVALQAGTYMVTVDTKCITSSSSTATLVVGEESATLTIHSTVPEGWDTAELTFTLEEEATLSMGVSISFAGDSPNGSFLIDNFRLYSINYYDYNVTKILSNPSFEEYEGELTEDETRSTTSDNTYTGGAYTITADQLTGWDVVIADNSTIDLMTEACKRTDNDFGAPGRPADGTYMLYLRDSWATAESTVKQSITLPAGDYMITVDTKCISTSSATATLVAGEESVALTVHSTMPEGWDTAVLGFTLEEATEVSLGVVVDFTGANGSFLLDNFQLFSTQDVVVWEMTSAGWGTMILPFDADVPSALTLYAGDELKLEEDGSTLTVGEASTSIAANTPYLVKGTEGTYTFTGTPVEAESLTSGMLTGTLVDMEQDDFPTTGGTVYVLQNHEDDDEGLAFYPITSDSEGVTLDAYHCYLTIAAEESEDGEPAKLSIVLPGAGEETGIVAVEGAEAEANGAIYDLSGRRVAKAVKGVYIQNGKKVLVK